MESEDLTTFVIPKNGDLVIDLAWSGDDIKDVYITYKDEKIWEYTTTPAFCQGGTFPHTLNLLPCGYHEVRVVIQGKNVKLHPRFRCFEDIELRKFMSTRNVLLKNRPELIEINGDYTL